jgi:peptide/nickel transport system permease protein
MSTEYTALSEAREDYKKQNQLKEVWRRLRKNKLAIVGMVIVLVLIIMAVFADQLAPYDYAAQNVKDRFLYPSFGHPLGTDNLGRDILSRVIFGGRVSLLVSLIALVLSLAAGGVMGCVAGYFGGMVDAVIMRATDILMAVPQLLLAVAVSAVLGGGVMATSIAIAVSGVAPAVRLLRSTIMTMREAEFVEAARAMGAGNARIIGTQILPNCLAPIIVDASLRIGGSILAISMLSFIGLGVQPPTPEWGSMLNDGLKYIRDFYPLITFPGVAIMLALFGFNVFGDGLRDALDPKLKQ